MSILVEAGFFNYPTPWNSLTIERLKKDKHNVFADYEAWEEWMNDVIVSDDDPWWEDLYVVHKASIFAAMSQACRQVAEEMEWKDKKPCTEK